MWKHMSVTARHMKTVKTVENRCENYLKTYENLKTVDLFKEPPPPLSFIKINSFQVFIRLATVFITVFNGFHSFHMFCSYAHMLPYVYI